jgi:predicted  nucleic acid-binding Zn-ribbon protein
MSSTRKLTTGGEVVSWCTKCRLDLVHRIIAMVDGVPVKVECKTCGSHHRYRKPAEDRAAEARVRTASPGASATTSKPRSASARALAEAAEENERERLWQSRIAGQPAHAFVLYTPRQSFKEGDLMRHAKFGDGFVVRVIDANKIEVLFRDGARTLAHAIG